MCLMIHSIDLLNMIVKVLQIIGSTSFITKREIPSSADDVVLITSGILPGVVSCGMLRGSKSKS